MFTILMIEDDENFARLVQKIMNTDEYTVLHASTAFAGLQIATSQHIDLVLLDMDLPDLDGKVVANRLRGRPDTTKVPVIAVTAKAEGNAKRMALAFGCDGFIPKPVDTRLFPSQVAAFLTKHP
jgi:two-component system, cell cycle response regulator DivK